MAASRGSGSRAFARADLDRVEGAIEPLVEARDLLVYDVELNGSGRARVLRVSVTGRDGAGVDIDALASLSRDIGTSVEDHIDGAFQLEVSSPGLERALRRAEHYATAIGERVSIKHTPLDAPPRRDLGVLCSADCDAVVLRTDDGTESRIAIDSISAARTVFEWAATPKPGTPKPGKKSP